MKLCNKCQIKKDINQFSKSKKSPDGLFPWCKLCRKEYDVERYSKIGSDKWTEIRKIRLNEIKTWFVEFKQTLKCQRCPETHPSCLDFHHTKSNTKDDTVSNLVVSGASKKTILSEIKKCEVLCANCHRKHHFKYGNSGIPAENPKV